MSWGEKVFDAFRDVLRLQDKIQGMDQRVALQQAKIEALSLEVAQLKIAVTILLNQAGLTPPHRPPFDQPPLPPTTIRS